MPVATAEVKNDGKIGQFYADERDRSNCLPTPEVKAVFEKWYKKPYIVVSKRECFDCHNNCPYIGNKTVWPCLEDITVDYAWKIIEKMVEDNR